MMQDDDDQAWIDAASAAEEPPPTLLALERIRGVLVSMSGCIAAGEPGPDMFQVDQALAALLALETQILRRERDLAEFPEPENLGGARPLTLANVREAVGRLKAQGMRPNDPPRELPDPHAPAIRKLPDAEPRIEQGPVQFGEQWPGLYLSGKSCFIYSGILERACRVLDALPLAEGMVDIWAIPALCGLVKDLRSPILILRRRDSRR